MNDMIVIGNKVAFQNISDKLPILDLLPCRGAGGHS